MDLTVTELKLEGVGLLVAGSEPITNLPTDYILARMRQEDGKFFLVRVKNSKEKLFCHQIPRGTKIGDSKVAMFHNRNVYNDNHAVIGAYEDLSKGAPIDQFLVRIYPSRY